MGTGFRRLTQLVMLALLLLFASAQAESPPPSQGKLRALLIGCDYFVTQENTYPAADHNLHMLADALSADRRRYALIRSYSGTIASIDAFEEAVLSAFQNCSPQDTSLLYISTHGVFLEEADPPLTGLYLSDGQQETVLDAARLQQILNTVPGKKVVILDACNAGAVIGKGLAHGTGSVFLSGPDYKVLCSAGGSEASWYFQGGADAAVGASYFATVLSDGLGARGDPAADQNADGMITLAEAYNYLRDNYAASTPQVYPQDDSAFVLFSYDPLRPRKIAKAVTGVTFEDTLLTAGQCEVSFSFTVQRQVELYYQIIYHRDGAWQFGQAQQFQDSEQTDGTVLPGRKIRTLMLNTPPDAYGYAMIQLITLEDGQPVFQGARLLCVQPTAAEVHLNVLTEPAFFPGLGEEMHILVQIDVPCGLTVNILDSSGRTVRRLSYEAPSRPQQLSPPGCTYYWDGRMSSGESAAPGEYTVQVKVRLNEEQYAAMSAPFLLLGTDHPGANSPVP